MFLIGYLWGVNFERDWAIDRLEVTFVNTLSRFYHPGSILTKYIFFSHIKQLSSRTKKMSLVELEIVRPFLKQN